MKDGRQLPKVSILTLRITQVICLFCFRILFFIKIKGLGNIPESGPVILAPNHNSYFDPPFVGLKVKRPIHYITWDALFRIPVLRWYIKKLGAIPIHRQYGQERSAYQVTKSLLEFNEVVCIFPEGERSSDGKLGILQPGVVRLAISANCPIVPVKITGAYKCWPKPRLFFRPFVPITVEFKEPIIPSVPSDRTARKEEVKRILERLDKDIESVN
jgi:1-acyl-sn-glycerol-3-phosphate acyltransferase